MVAVIPVPSLWASDHCQPQQATAEDVVLLDEVRCRRSQRRCSTQAWIEAQQTGLHRLRQAIRSEADRCNVLFIGVQAACLSSASACSGLIFQATMTDHLATLFKLRCEMCVEQLAQLVDPGVDAINALH